MQLIADDRDAGRKHVPAYGEIEQGEDTVPAIGEGIERRRHIVDQFVGNGRHVWNRPGRRGEVVHLSQIELPGERWHLGVEWLARLVAERNPQAKAAYEDGLECRSAELVEIQPRGSAGSDRNLNRCVGAA